MKKTSAFNVFKSEGRESLRERRQSHEGEINAEKVGRSSKAEKPRDKGEAEKDGGKNSVRVDTPAKSLLPDTEKRKQKSSLKKIKSLMSRSKKGRPSLESFVQSSPLIRSLTVKKDKKNSKTELITDVHVVANNNNSSRASLHQKGMNGQTPDINVVKTFSTSLTRKLVNGTGDEEETKSGRTSPPGSKECTNTAGGGGLAKRKRNDSIRKSSESIDGRQLMKRSRPSGCEEPIPSPPARISSLLVKQEDLSGSYIVWAEKGASTVPSPSGGKDKKKTSKLNSSKLGGPEVSLRPLPLEYDSSLLEAQQVFERLIEPVTPAKFFKDIWEQKPLFVRRHDCDHNNEWFSTKELDQIIRQKRVCYTENLDIVSYTDGVRETHNPPGRAYPAVVWDYYSNGCSVRLLNPQTYSEPVWRQLSLLQEYFGCVAGANIYLTPPNTQGFAPHYDDIEAFVCQLEGKKRWRVYEPRNESEVLPRFSSQNYTDADLGEPVLDVVLEAGDLLYFPRGFIHQGNTMEGAHSLHITVSVGQKNTWGDLLEKLVPRALEVAIEEDVEFRKSLPRDMFNYMGVAFSETKHPDRKSFLQVVDSLMSKLKNFAPVDAGCDQLAKRFLEDSLPPCLTYDEKQCSIYNEDNGARWNSAVERVTDTVGMDADTEIRIIRRGSVRLVTEDSVCIYHNLENSRLYHETVSKSVEVDAEMAEAVEFLLHAYPEYVRIDSLPLESLEKQVSLAADLYERGLVLTRCPLEPVDDLD